MRVQQWNPFATATKSVEGAQVGLDGGHDLVGSERRQRHGGVHISLDPGTNLDQRGDAIFLNVDLGVCRAMGNAELR